MSWTTRGRQLGPAAVPQSGPARCQPARHRRARRYVPYQSLDADGCEEVEPPRGCAAKVVGATACRGTRQGLLPFTRPWRQARRLGVTFVFNCPSTRSGSRRTRRGGPGRRAALPGRRHRPQPALGGRRHPAPRGGLPRLPGQGYSLTLPMTDAGAPRSTRAGRTYKVASPTSTDGSGGRHGRTRASTWRSTQTPRYGPWW